MTKDELLIVREALNSPVVLTPALKTTPMITTKAIALIDKALEQPEHHPKDDIATLPEPVAWVHLKPWLEDGDWPDDCFNHIPRSGWTPLYISPVNSQPLTDEDIFALENSVPDAVVSDRDWCIYFARAIEAAHGIKGEA